MKSNLDKNLLEFLNSSKIPNKKLSILKSDASKRRYYRITNKEKNFLVMDSSSEKKSLSNFIKISDWLKKKGYSVPNIFNKSISKGFCLIEDFGNTKFSDLKNKNLKEQYNLTIKLLISLSKNNPPEFLNNYSSLIFKKELKLFIDWYLFYNKKKHNVALSSWNEIWTNYFLQINKFNKKCIVLRDFHIDNLFWLQDRNNIRKIGLIDFQDALVGHPCYDLASLLQDVRVNLSKNEQDRLYSLYMTESGLDDKLFEESYFIFGTQRLIKIIGIFYRLNYLDKKSNYLEFLPRTWELLKLNLNYPQLKNLSVWFKNYVF